METRCANIRIYLLGASEVKRKTKQNMYIKNWINNGQILPRSTEKHETSE